jgi:hypothetical protein
MLLLIDLPFLIRSILIRFRYPIPLHHKLFEGISLVVDGTDCPVDAPTNKDAKLGLCNTRQKDNGHSQYNLKYTVLVQISTGKIMGVFGPDLGKVPDINAFILHEGEMKLNEGEIILGDKGYQGHPRILSGIKATKGHPLDYDDMVFNYLLDSVRQVVECTFQRLKNFGVLGKSGRFHCAQKKHKAVFNVCAQFTNLMIDRDPVWGEINKMIF